MVEKANISVEQDVAVPDAAESAVAPKPKTKKAVRKKRALSPKTKRTKAQRTAEMRQSIIDAAAYVVGKRGYAEASISRITEKAGIAQGTFYLYFSSRQDLFDQLLPDVGRDMLEFIRESVHGASSFYEVEERGFRAFFQFCKKNPGFFRILNEAEVAAPKGYKKHFDVLVEHYVGSMKRSIDGGEITDFSDKELEALAYMMMASRSYLYMAYVKDKGTKGDIPDWVVQAYMKVVHRGIG